jgi:hypothetical protein
VSSFRQRKAIAPTVVLAAAALIGGACSQKDPASGVTGGSSSGATGSGGSSGGASSGGTSTSGASGSTGGTIIVPDSGTGPCEGLECKQTTCSSGACEVPACTTGALTTVSGTVYDPSGTLPLYNVMVYVPNGPLEPLTEGATCNTCDVTVSGTPVATAL